MLDKFTKSKVEPPVKAHTLRSDRLPGLEDAWRIAHAIDNALKAAESERSALSNRVEDATAWAAVFARKRKGKIFRPGKPPHISSHPLRPQDPRGKKIRGRAEQKFGVLKL